MDIEASRINNFVLLKKKAIKVTIIDTGLLQLDDQDVARHIKDPTVCNAEEHPRGAPQRSTPEEHPMSCLQNFPHPSVFQALEGKKGEKCLPHYLFFNSLPNFIPYLSFLFSFPLIIVCHFYMHALAS